MRIVAPRSTGWQTSYEPWKKWNELSNAFYNGNDNDLDQTHSGCRALGFLKIPTISRTRPPRIKMGATVILLKLYTSEGLNTLGSLLFPPIIKRRPSMITAKPMVIHR